MKPKAKLRKRALLAFTLQLAAGLGSAVGQERFGANGYGPRERPAAPEVVVPLMNEAVNLPRLAPPRPAEGDKLLPINLATALRLAGARSLVVQAAEAAVVVETGGLQRARALWLPSVNFGFSYVRHDGGAQIPAAGQIINNSRNEFLLGAGPVAVFAFADAIYAPLVAQQTVRARQFEVQAAHNDALLEVAEAYFNVQQSRGRLAGLEDAVAKARVLADRIDQLGKALVPPIEVERARTTLAEFEQQLATARRDWRVYSIQLNRVLRLNPSAVTDPLEPPQVRVTLIAPQVGVDDLIPIALTARPELASQQAIVQATLAALRREKVRPLIPSLILQGSAVPGEHLSSGLYSAGLNGSLSQTTSRSDLNVQLLWQLENLGFGNRGRRTVARGEQMRATIELFRTQDTIAAEVSRAHAEVDAAVTRINRAEAGLIAAGKSYEGNFKGLSETVRLGETLQLVVRPLEVVAALQQLQQAYTNYYTSANDYNIAQFRLFRALGYPSQTLAAGDHFGPSQPIDTSRPAPLPPVPDR